jgi:cytoskeleton protein RodZ
VLKTARKKRGLTAREAADRLNLMPDYVDILERDDYQALRSPQFAKGYVKAYGRLLGLDEQQLLSLFDESCGAQPEQRKPPAETRPVQLQRTGLGVAIGLGVLLLLVAGLWWWGQGRNEASPSETEDDVSLLPGNAPQPVGVEL